MSGRRPLGLLAAAAGVALVGFMVVRRGGAGAPPPARVESARPAAPALPVDVQPAATATLPPPPAAAVDAPAAALTATGVARALHAIARNEQTRQLYARLQPLGLSREQRERVVLILGTQALRPAEESPMLQALRASGRTGLLSDEEAQRIRDERQQIADRTLRSFRPALASVLTPAQLAQAGLSGDGATKTH